MRSRPLPARNSTAPLPIPAARGFAVTTLFIAVLVALWLTSSAWAEPLSGADLKQARAAFTAVDKNHWKQARRHAAAVGNPLVAKIVRWMDYERRGTDADFDAIAAFIDKNPDWPLLSILRVRAEESLPAGAPPEKVLAWFQRHPPIGTDGLIQRASALLAIGESAAGRAAVREAWIKGNFGKSQERHFFRRYRKLLTQADHQARLDRLMWKDRYWQARRMLWRVDAAHRALAEARLALMHGSGGVDRLIARVPKKLKNDPGLIYDRLRWRRRKGRYDSARELLDDLPAHVPHPRKWWIERDILARKALEDGFITDAYRIAKNHGLKATPANAAEYAEAEWLAGWIALRFLGDKAIAMDHFVAMYQQVNYPISRARGAYWAARAAEALGMTRSAKRWYAIAASLPTTFYGQLALLKVAPKSTLKIPPEPKPTAKELAAFSGQELVKVVKILHQVGEENRLRPFILALAEISDKPGWQALTATLAHAAERPDLGVQAAKNAERGGTSLVKAGYPAIDLPEPVDGVDGDGIEPALALAVIRQESAFWPQAVSSAGARGLMQLMPATAKHVAKTYKVAYAHRRLIEDPHYNVRLGTAYLAQMVRDFDGSYILALAAYNAGPSRVRQWIKELGRPGHSLVDAIDWIESVPFGETRNYIQRVLENLQVYRSRLARKPLPVGLEGDLLRPGDRQSG